MSKYANYSIAKPGDTSGALANIQKGLMSTYDMLVTQPEEKARQAEKDLQAKQLFDAKMSEIDRLRNQRNAENEYYKTILDKTQYKPGGISDAYEMSSDVQKRMADIALTKEEQDAITRAGITGSGETDWAAIPEANRELIKRKSEEQMRLGQDWVNDPKFKANTMERMDIAKQALLDAGGSMTYELSKQALTAQNVNKTLRGEKSDAADAQIAKLKADSKVLEEKQMKAQHGKTTGKSSSGTGTNSGIGQKLTEKHKVDYREKHNLDVEDVDKVVARLAIELNRKPTTKEFEYAIDSLYKEPLWGEADVSTKTKDIANIAAELSKKNNYDNQLADYYKTEKEGLETKIATQKALMDKYNMGPEEARNAELKLAIEGALGKWEAPTSTTTNKLDFANIPLNEDNMDGTAFTTSDYEVVPVIQEQAVPIPGTQYKRNPNDAFLDPNSPLGKGVNRLGEMFASKPGFTVGTRPTKTISKPAVGIQPSSVQSVLDRITGADTLNNIVTQNTATSPASGTTKPGYYDPKPVAEIKEKLENQDYDSMVKLADKNTPIGRAANLMVSEYQEFKKQIPDLTWKQFHTQFAEQILNNPELAEGIY